MKHASTTPALCRSAHAVRLALLTLGGLGTFWVATRARAEDAAVTALTQPVSTVEIGIGDTSSGSAKAHEYDGIKRKGSFFIGNFDVRGGGSWDSTDVSRWRIFGRALGTDSRSLGAEQSEQGKGRFSVTYDELQHNLSDTYQTPLLGAGTRSLTLPGNWLVPVVPRVSTTAANARGLSPDVTNSSALVSGVLTAPTPTQLAQAAAMQATDLPAFHSVALGTKRTRFELAALVNLGTRWDITAVVGHEDRVGLKPMGTVTAFTGGDISTIIPDLIDQHHDQVTLGLNYTGDSLVVQTHYYLSSLTNNVASLSRQNWALPGSANNTQTISSAPGNQLHQLGANANWRIAAGTRLAASLSYGRSTQNAAFITDSGTPLVPVASLSGLVVNKALGLKLTSHPLQSLNLSAAYKYDLRDNQTPVNTYAYYDAGAVKSGTSVFSAAFPTLGLGSNSNLNANRPYSKKIHQLDLDAEGTVARGHLLRAGVQQQKIERWCNGTWIACVDADSARETTVHADYVFKALDNFNARLGLAHGSRTVNYNEDAFLALVPMANVSPAGAPGGSTAYSTLTALGVTGYGPVLGLNPLPAAGSAAAFFFANNNALANALYGSVNRISELPGLRRYNEADRTRDKVRSTLSWQASDALSLQGGVDVNRDTYGHSVYGLLNARGWSANLDAGYAAGESTLLGAWLTFEDQRSTSAGNSYTANSTAANVNGFTAIQGGCFSTIVLRNASNKVDPCLNWMSTLHDQVTTLGLSATRRDLVGGKLELSGGLSFSSARTASDIAGGNYVNNPLAVAGAAPGTVAAYFVSAQPLPDVTTRTVEARIGARWKLDEARSLRLGYRWQHLTSTDWAYDGLQPGGLAGVLPSYQQAPSYSVHTLSVAYLLSFR